MIGLTTGTQFTKMSLHELGGSGRIPSITKVSTPGMERLTTRDVPMSLVKNLMSLHESAAPGSVKGFARNIFKVGLMDELLTDAVQSRQSLASPSKRVDMKNPEQLMGAFYAASFLQNEEARECLVYSHEGKVVGMAQVGRFAPKIDGLSCTISNLVVSPKLDATSQGAIIRHVASQAKEQMGEATLLTAEPWGADYATHGFAIESAGPSAEREHALAEAEIAARDPVGATIFRQAGVSPVQNRCEQRGNIVRCRWSG